MLEGEPARVVLESYVRRQLQDHLRRRDGEKVPDAVIDDLLEWAGLREKPENDDETRYERFKVAIDKVVDQNYGSGEAFNEELQPILTRRLGLYASEHFGSSPRKFEYTMTMPAPIVETNGFLVSDRRVRWTFDGSEAYPFGRKMACRALELKKDQAQAVLKTDVLEDRTTQLEFLKLVSQEPMLQVTLRTCVAEKSPDPIYRDRHALPEDDGRRSLYDALLTVLKLPQESS